MKPGERQKQGLYYLLAAAFLISLPTLFETMEDRSGLLLVATARASKPFDEAIVYVASRGPFGASGIILNKPLMDHEKWSLPVFLQKAGIRVDYGGPVNFPENIYVLQKAAPGSSPQDGLFDVSLWDDAVWKTPDLIKRLADDEKKGMHRYRVFVGRVGWGPGQLAREIFKYKSWTIEPLRDDVVFQEGENLRWKSVVRRKTAMK